MVKESRERVLKAIRKGIKKSALLARHLREELYGKPSLHAIGAAEGLAETAGTQELISKFAQEASYAMANVYRARSSADALECIARIASGKGAKIVARWSRGLPLAEMIDSALASLEVITPDGGEWPSKIAAADMGLTGADFAVAETGSIVLIAGPGKPGSASLLPPVHLALVRESSILPNLEELFAAIRGRAMSVLGVGRHINIITGPSRTGDIEQTLTLGAHGPKELHLLILPDL